MAKLRERALKWLLPVLIVVEIVLVGTGRLDLGAAIGVAITVEVLLVVVAGRQLFVAVRRYRRQRTVGLDVWAALEDGLTVLLPRPLARLVSLEPRMIACLLRWIFWRQRQVAGLFSYHRRSWGGALLLLVLLTAPVEIFLFELLVPWAWLRWTLLIAALYAVLWAGGFVAALRVLPHRLESGAVRLRHGIWAEVLIPYREIASVEQQSLRAPGGREGLVTDRNEGSAYLAVGGRTDVTIRLRAARSVRGLLRPTPPVTMVHVAADDSARLTDGLRQHVRESHSPTATEVAAE